MRIRLLLASALLLLISLGAIYWFNQVQQRPALHQSSDRPLNIRPARPPTPVPSNATIISRREGAGLAPEEGSLDSNRTQQMRALAGQLRDHPEKVRDLLAALLAETDPEKIGLLAEIIAENSDVIGDQMPLEELRQLAESGAPLPQRAAALRILGKALLVTPEIMRSVFDLSRKDESNDIRISAIAAASHWMSGYPEMKEQMQLELLQTRDASQDATVRGLAIQTIALQDRPLKGALLAGMTDSLRSEEAEQNRAIAAFGLAGGASPETQATIVKELTDAYNRETGLETRRQMLAQIVRTATDQSPEILAGLPAPDPLLRQDINDYLEILREGTTDFPSIWEEKEKRDGTRGSVIGAGVPQNDPP